MAKPSTNFYDEAAISAISHTVSEKVDAAALGAIGWDEVTRALTECFPRSVCALLNFNTAENRLNFEATDNIEPAFVKAYAEHFAPLNPWTPIWRSVPSGTVLVAEESCPTRMFTKTEFYNDWMRPQKNNEGAVGVKIDGGRDLIHLSLHYPLAVAGTYDFATAEILRRIRGSLLRSINVGRLLQVQTEAAVARSALVERGSCAAFVVDGDRRVRLANEQAEKLFSSGSVVKQRFGIASLSDPYADKCLREGVWALSRRLPVLLSRLHICVDGQNWQVSLASLPAVVSGGPTSLVLADSLVLILVKNLATRSRDAAEWSALGAKYGLTPSEIVFCQRLASGASLAEVAQALGISKETARNRVKSIFHKTGTHRQGELVAMLAAFG
ncbi:helix-turn-helix transcriptional regulator [Sinorhizobium fredii]|uniref:helix-turn-helix transcriptional regulator n=1 Tax=Rhizobium fredii TaxID=380 RepID=UPI0004BB63C0|nr:helix-turn-helix transcriptional regulator [Sinorhizobium fredii]